MLLENLDSSWPIGHIVEVAEQLASEAILSHDTLMNLCPALDAELSGPTHFSALDF